MTINLCGKQLEKSDMEMFAGFPTQEGGTREAGTEAAVRENRRQTRVKATKASSLSPSLFS